MPEARSGVAAECLVTGASGFIGRRLVDVLVAHGHRVRAPSRASGYDLCRPETLMGLCDGIDTLYHVAGYAHATTADTNRQWQVNYQGTVSLLEEAHRAGVRRVVLVSSVKAGLLDDPAGIPFDAYGQAKRSAERVLFRQFEDRHAVVVRPALVYGAGVKGNLARMAEAMQQGWFPPLPRSDQRRSLVDRDDLVHALMHASQQMAVNGRVLIATSHTPTAAELYCAIRLSQGKTSPVWSTPYALLAVGARVGSALERLTQRSMPLTPAVLERLFGDGVYQGDSALEALQLQARPFQVGIADMINGLQSA